MNKTDFVHFKSSNEKMLSLIASTEQELRNLVCSLQGDISKLKATRDEASREIQPCYNEKADLTLVTDMMERVHRLEVLAHTNQPYYTLKENNASIQQEQVSNIHRIPLILWY